jgi:hypothetical protein
LRLVDDLAKVLIGAPGELVVGWEPAGGTAGGASLGLHSLVTNEAIALSHNKSVVGALLNTHGVED